MKIPPCITQFLRAVAGKPRLKAVDERSLRAMIEELRFSASGMRVMADALCDPNKRPDATVGRECEYYDSCPFLVPANMLRLRPVTQARSQTQS